MYVYVYIYIRICMYIYIYIYVCVYVHIRIRMYTHMLYMHVCVKYVFICTGCCMRSQWIGRLLNLEIPAVMESYGMAWYLLSCYIMLNYIVCFVFYHYCVVFKLFTRSYKLCSKFDCLEKWSIRYVSYYVKVRVSCLFSAWSI